MNNMTQTTKEQVLKQLETLWEEEAPLSTVFSPLPVRMNELVSSALDTAYERGVKDAMEKVEKERQTWARESIGEKAVVSVRLALSELLKK